jgi:hypothetical protein
MTNLLNLNEIPMTLACGPYLPSSESGMWTSLALFLLVKPLAYFAFIQAFRYRVSRVVPMRFSQAAKLAALRAVLGIGIVGVGAAILLASRSEALLMISWIFLYGERVFSWWLVGSKGAGLRGRRLLGWVISGTCINVAFDVAMVWGMLEGPMPPVLIVAGIAVFIAALHVVGRRDSLKRRFASITHCMGCGYDLTGNLSGRCPECGMTIGAAPNPA